MILKYEPEIRQKEVEIRKTKEATQEKKKLRHAALPAEVC